jgi:uncharacterized metal-binding protein
MWGLFLLSLFSFRIAKQQKKKAWKVVAEHLIIALVVVIIAHCIGDWVSSTFG